MRAQNQQATLPVTSRSDASDSVAGVETVRKCVVMRTLVSASLEVDLRFFWCACYIRQVLVNLGHPI